MMLVPLTLAWWGHPRLVAPLRILALVPVFLLVMYAASWIGKYFFHYNLIVGHATTFGEGLLYLWYLRRLLADTRYRRWPPFFQVTFVVFGLLDSFVLEGFKQLNTYTNALESLFVPALVLMYFEHLLHTPHFAPRLSREPTFAANVGIVIYLMGTVVLYLILNHYILLNDADMVYQIFTLNIVMQLVLSSLLARCFWLARQAIPSQEMAVREY